MILSVISYIVVAITAAIFFVTLVRGSIVEWGSGNKKNDPSHKDKISSILKKTQEEELDKIKSDVTGILSEKDKSSRDYFTAKISSAIDYAIKRHDWYEEQRAKILQSGFSLFSFTALVLGIIIKTSPNFVASFTVKLTVLVIAILCLITILRVVVLYNSELDADRPYRLISDIKTWYFRYNLPSSSMDCLKAIEQQANKVANERKEFFDRIISQVDLNQSIREDLEQIFILQVLQRYKSESLTKMRWTISAYVVAMTVLFCLLIAISLFN